LAWLFADTLFAVADLQIIFACCCCCCCLCPVQEMMRDFLEREKRKQAEREAAKAAKAGSEATAQA
jgi:L-lactate utilization protein LutB